MECKECGEQMICINYKKVLDTEKNMYYDEYTWVCQGCSTELKETLYG